jgi:hypothetical protein
MKAITLTQPWATLVAIGKKTIETRSWSTSYRGPLAIHAAKTFPKHAWQICLSDPFKDILLRSGFTYLADINLYKHQFPLGAVIATCELVACIRIPDMDLNLTFNGKSWLLPPQEPELSFGDYIPGRFAWILSNVKPLPEPIPARGALGLWEWE